MAFIKMKGTLRSAFFALITINLIINTKVLILFYINDYYSRFK